MLKLYNSLSRKKEVFLPLSDSHVTLYVCGITPYDTTHLGHAFTYISFDSLVRYLEYTGHRVLYTQNVTDINDRDSDILQRAKEQDIPWNQLAKYWTNRFLKDMTHLNWRKPDCYLKASEHIRIMITLIQNILENGYAYCKNGCVYLDVEKDHEFGKLSRYTKEEMLLRAKEFQEDLTNPDKKHPLDITLWKGEYKNQPSHIPSFDSPWGKGRPGWHIECSAMAIHSLGKKITIHGGGIDLIYPHHESEIAQSETATGEKPFAKYWLHTGTVHINGEKMSKSLGNLILISNLLQQYSPQVIRWVLLSHHYRKPWNYNEKEFEEADKSLTAITKYLHNVFPAGKTDFKQRAMKYLDDDLHIDMLLKSIGTSISKEKKNQQQQKEMKEILTMLGFVF